MTDRRDRPCSCSVTKSLRYEMLVVVKSESAGLKSGVEKSV